jgi:pilus assembly protein Flp/PilA
MFKRFVKDESGAALVEYGLLVGLIAVVCILGITTLGDNVKAAFCDINTSLAGKFAGAVAGC